MQNIEVTLYQTPFPHAIVDNFYNEEELELIWEELKFYTKPGKLLDAKDYGGVDGYTSAKAILLDSLYQNRTGNGGLNWRTMSNILTTNRKLFTSGVLDAFAEVDDCCCLANQTNNDITKVRYYHNGDAYDPHTDKGFQFLAFSYFYKEPKKFEGGQLYFPKYDYEIPCDNNSVIIFPGWVEHGVREISIKDSDYFDGYGRYAITSFFGCKPKSVNN
jgi:hypothetical protein